MRWLDSTSMTECTTVTEYRYRYGNGMTSPVYTNLVKLQDVWGDDGAVALEKRTITVTEWEVAE